MNAEEIMDHANDMMDRATAMVRRAVKSVEDFQDVLEEIDTDSVLAESIIGEENDMGKPNLLIQKRQEIKQLELAVQKAKTVKEAADIALKSKIEAHKASQPVLADGVVATFQMKNSRVRPPTRMIMTDRGMLSVPAEDSATRIIESERGTLIEVSRDAVELVTMIEKEAATMAHHEYVTLAQKLSTARVELKSFEIELTRLRDRVQCLTDL